MDKLNTGSHNVLTMTDLRAETGYTALTQVEAYWEALRRTRQMPKRSEIDPRGIEKALEHTFVLERIAPGIARIRIAGSHLSDLMGMEVRGMPLTSLITPPCRRQISDALEEVFQRPAICELRLATEDDTKGPQMEGRLLLLPLKSDLGDVSRILGCLVAHGDIGRNPRRFDIVGAEMRPITAPSAAPQQPTEILPLRSMPAKTQGFAETQTAFETRTPRPDVPYLRLVKTDET